MCSGSKRELLVAEEQLEKRDIGLLIIIDLMSSIYKPGKDVIHMIYILYEHSNSLLSGMACMLVHTQRICPLIRSTSCRGGGFAQIEKEGGHLGEDMARRNAGRPE